MWKPLSHLGDAAIAVGLLFALNFGVELRWIVGLMLVLGCTSSIMKAFKAFLEPIVEALKIAKGRHS